MPIIVLPPWANGAYSNPLWSTSQRLSREIQDFATYVIQIFEDSKHLYEATIHKIVAVTQRVLPEARIQPFGSYATGLCIPTSDLDLVCIIRESSVENFRKAFRALSRELKKETWAVSVKAIETASVPIIKLLSQEERIPTDITFDCVGLESAAAPAGAFGFGFGPVPQHRGTRSVELMRRYAAETPKLRPLLLVLKQFLHERGLNNPYTGGLGSYCLLIMVKTFLHLFDTTGTVLDEGGALTAFLRYYGTVFDYATMGISTKHGGEHFRIGEVGHFLGSGPLVIEDPFDPMSNIASGVFAMWRVRAAFESAFAALTGPEPPNTFTLLSRLLNHDDEQ
jgi:DNA polymerase sigma